VKTNVNMKMQVKGTVNTEGKKLKYAIKKKAQNLRKRRTYQSKAKANMKDGSMAST
jgi:hypothetical protein